MELKDYLVNQYYLGSKIIYNSTVQRNKRIIESLPILQKAVIGDIKQIVIKKEYCYFELKDRRKYIFEKSNNLDMLALYSIDPKYENLIKKIVTPSSNVLEVGACWGYYTVLLSNFVGTLGHVHAFEPICKAYDLLSQNVQLNHCENVFLHKIALTNINGNIKLRQIEDRLFFSSTKSNFKERYKEENCKTVRMDDYIDEKFDIIKVDIEGAECLFLDGAKTYISKHSPIIIMEVFRIGLAAHDCSGNSICKRLPGYKAFVANEGVLEPIHSLEELECEDVFFLKEEHIKKCNLF